MADRTALERAKLTIAGDRAELRVEDGRITVTKEAPTRAAPTEVTVGTDQVRGTQLQLPSRRARGWLHLSVVGGSPVPPGELAAAGDPYTLPLVSRAVVAAKRFARLVDRHLHVRGMPPDLGGQGDGRSPSVAVRTASTTAPEAASPRGPSANLVKELQALAELHASGALTDDEFDRAKARLLR